MSRNIFLSIIMVLALVACNDGKLQNPTNHGKDEGDSDLGREMVKNIEADYYGKKSNSLYYVSMRFATVGVGYVTNADSSVYVSGSGEIIDVLLAAPLVDENKVPMAGTYVVGSEEASYTALSTVHSFGYKEILPAVYKVANGDVSAAISYNSGSVQVTKNSEDYKIKLTLDCSDGTTRKYEFDGQMSVIDKSQTCNVESIYFREGSSLTIVSGNSRSLSVSFSPYGQTDYVMFEVSDPIVARIVGTSNTTCTILARKEGTCDVTARCVNNNCSATITINVRSLSSVQYEFGDLDLMQPTDGMQEERYCIYTLRAYRGDIIQDGGDASLTKVIDDSKSFPDPGTWLYRYTADNGAEFGIFADSVRSQRAWLLSTDAIFDYDGQFRTYGFAPVMEFKLIYMFDNIYAYCLGNCPIVSDATVTDTIRKPGVAARPMPNTIQASRFNQSGYLSYCTALLNGSNINWNENWPDYNVFEEGDAHLLFALSDYDNVTTGLFGCVNSGYIEFGFGDGNTSAWLKAENYDISATVYENPMAHCLATETTTDPSTGQISEQFVVPYQMAESKNINYTKGQNQKSATRRELAIPKWRLQKQMEVNNTIFAVLRMYMYSPKKRWY